MQSRRSKQSGVLILHLQLGAPEFSGSPSPSPLGQKRTPALTPKVRGAPISPTKPEGKPG
jgi:hypothetical protein